MLPTPSIQILLPPHPNIHSPSHLPLLRSNLCDQCGPPNPKSAFPIHAHLLLDALAQPVPCFRPPPLLHQRAPCLPTSQSTTPPSITLGLPFPNPSSITSSSPPPLYPVAADPVSLGCLATGCFSTGLLHHLLQHNIYLLPSISFCLSNRLVCLVVKPSSVRPYAVVCALLLSLNVISWNEK